ncbi:hypothetical protein EIK76_11030 [Rheinheimera mesophila]|uniref:DUF945 family protein n=1 Tax=Rheinheimera mesophila TaxID=1547515 RepID=A0A3P3QJR4_9GAMM|nr:hypothetical protein [Rheinheimera mesophila]KKK99944.1 hypothetical protein SD53_16935 [Rheinheimera mesophila]RRJ21401.1 hypothetical protein EIK76_11030 [Rheinheimera mesophila]
MAKKVWLGVVLVLSASAVAGFLYANHHAEQLMAGHIERSNQQYLQLAEQGDMPPIQMSYSELSANVITSSYKIQNLHIGIAGMGDLVSVGQVELIGLQREGLPKDGAARLKDLKLAPQALAALPKDLADYLTTLVMEMSYQYKYKEKTGELTFQQELRVDHHFSLNYRFALTGVTELWQFAENIHGLTPEQQQQQSEQPDYLPDLMKRVGAIGVASGSFEIENKAFLQQLFEQLAAARMTTDYNSSQQQLSSAIMQNPQIPAVITEPVLNFLKQPERLKLSFQFQQPPTFSQMQDGSALAGIETAEDFINFAGLTIEGNAVSGR